MDVIVYDKLDKIAQMSNTTGEDITLIKNNVTTLLNQSGGGGGVKSVQRGVVQLQDKRTQRVTVNFTSINTSKAIVLLQPSHNDESTGDYSIMDVQASLSVLNATSMEIVVSASGYLDMSSMPSDGKLNVSWQVVEF